MHRVPPPSMQPAILHTIYWPTHHHMIADHADQFGQQGKIRMSHLSHLQKCRKGEVVDENIVQVCIFCVVCFNTTKTRQLMPPMPIN